MMALIFTAVFQNQDYVPSLPTLTERVTSRSSSISQPLCLSFLRPCDRCAAADIKCYLRLPSAPLSGHVCRAAVLCHRAARLQEAWRAHRRTTALDPADGKLPCDAHLVLVRGWQRLDVQLGIVRFDPPYSVHDAHPLRLWHPGTPYLSGPPHHLLPSMHGRLSTFLRPIFPR